MRLFPLTLALTLVLAPALRAEDAPVPRNGPESGAVVSRVSGESVRFVAEPQFRPLVLAQDLLGGDLVVTGENGVVGILFVDGTVMRLHPRTELLVKSVGTAAQLELRRGTIWARAARGRSDVTVTTPAAAAGIRGTDWVLAVEGGGLTRLTVYDGAVELSNPQGSVLAAAGEAAVASPGRAPVKVGVANRREAEQMLYTVGTSEAADLLTGAAEDLTASTAGNPDALARYRAALDLLRRGDPGAARALDRAAAGLDRERAATARWLAAFARMDQGGALRPPPPSNADADALGAAVAAAM
ncbi:FecR family protein, partial [Oceaniglobus roseus]|uniref:FecR family protein n=1 Tax=Oceaniglobus roseus TaxID=1737570 RepID=UPI001561AF55